MKHYIFIIAIISLILSILTYIRIDKESKESYSIHDYAKLRSGYCYGNVDMKDDDFIINEDYGKLIEKRKELVDKLIKLTNSLSLLYSSTSVVKMTGNETVLKEHNDKIENSQRKIQKIQKSLKDNQKSQTELTNKIAKKSMNKIRANLLKQIKDNNYKIENIENIENIEYGVVGYISNGTLKKIIKEQEQEKLRANLKKRNELITNDEKKSIKNEINHLENENETLKDGDRSENIENISILEKRYNEIKNEEKKYNKYSQDTETSKKRQDKKRKRLDEIRKNFQKQKQRDLIKEKRDMILNISKQKTMRRRVNKDNNIKRVQKVLDDMNKNIKKADNSTVDVASKKITENFNPSGGIHMPYQTCMY